MKRRVHDFIPWIKDYYTITSDGEIFSDRTGKMKLLNKSSQSKYKRIGLRTVDGRKQMFQFHRLVMMAFNPANNMEKLQVNHIDGNKENNALENLEWTTPLENTRHAIEHGLRARQSGEHNPASKLTWEDVRSIRLLSQANVSYKEIAQKFNTSCSYVYQIVRGERWKEK